MPKKKLKEIIKLDRMGMFGDFIEIVNEKNAYIAVHKDMTLDYIIKILAGYVAAELEQKHINNNLIKINEIKNNIEERISHVIHTGYERGMDDE